MFDKWRRYSYAAQKHHRYRLLKIILGFAALYVVYNLLITYGFSVWSVENDTMQSGLRPGDRLIVASYTFPTLVAGIQSKESPVKRGDIVLVDISRQEKHSLPMKILDGLVRFFTIQRVSILGKNSPVYIKRIIGLPNDTITMSNYVFKVKGSGESYSLTEFEMSKKIYTPEIPRFSAAWNESIPFSGAMDTRTLGPNEYFVVSDDRSNTNDSRTWGPVTPETLRGKAVFRFWPVTRIGIP